MGKNRDDRIRGSLLPGEPGKALPTKEQLEAAYYREKEKRKRRRTAGTVIIALVLAAAAAGLLLASRFCVVHIRGTSMEPVLADGDVILLDRDCEYVSGGTYGFYWQNRLLIKRLIALPGDELDIGEDGTVKRNGMTLAEPYLVDKSRGNCDINLPCVLPEDRYFFMGDRRSDSIDSRNALIGCVEAGQIAGKAVLRIWPLDRFGEIG